MAGKDKEIYKLTAELVNKEIMHRKDIEINVAKHQVELIAMRSELSLELQKAMRAEGALNARGVFEHMFELVHLATGRRGRANTTDSIALIMAGMCNLFVSACNLRIEEYFGALARKSSTSNYLYLYSICSLLYSSLYLSQLLTSVFSLQLQRMHHHLTLAELKKYWK